MNRFFLSGCLFLMLIFVEFAGAEEPLNRQAIVSRHDIQSHSLSLQIPVGDGQFCFNVDGTGLQTFGGSTMAHDGWFVEPLPEGYSWSDVPASGTFQKGRNQGADKFPEEKEALRQWMIDNPHSANLARIRLMKKNAIPLQENEIENLSRTMTLWTGVHASSFTVQGTPVTVTTCLGNDGIVALRIESELLKTGDLEVVVDFPWPSSDDGVWVGQFDSPAHPVILESMEKSSGNSVSFVHKLVTRMDDAVSFDFSRNVQLGWNLSTPCQIVLPSEDNPGKFRITAMSDVMEFFARFAAPLHEKSGGVISVDDTSAPLTTVKDVPPVFSNLSFAKLEQESRERWETFWKSGGAVDLSGSTDARWMELEHRIVLSQFEMRTNSAGDFPSPETGLLGTDPWRGKFHMEMVWWHLSHYYLWGRSDLAERGVSCYFRYKQLAAQLARQLGYKGYKWQKAVGPDGRTAPWIGNQVLLWKQPHPIFFAELDYRIHPTRETLEKWADIVDGTAEHMADYPVFDDDGVAHLDPVMPPSEQGITKDTVFDLAYWRWGLDKANEWRERMGKPRSLDWDEVRMALAPLPVNEEGVFVHSAEWFDSFSKRNWEHPDLIGVLGMLPPIDGVDSEIATRTVTKVFHEWQWDRCWGWDFPWMAMAAARTGQQELAIEILLSSSPRNAYDERGVNTGGPCPYLPGNGGLLYAIALMCAGWEQPAPDTLEHSLSNAPGFPDNGQWNVRWEGLQKAL